MEKKQTAVEWLINEHFGGIENCTPDFRNKIQQALEMEKEQIIDSFEIGYENGACVNKGESIYHGHNYYNNTYKSE